MSAGYVLQFNNRTFGDFVIDVTGLNIHADQYRSKGDSKANKLRVFWDIESDYVVGKLLVALVEYEMSRFDEPSEEFKDGSERCVDIANRLLAGSPRLDSLKDHATILDARHLAEQIRRMEESLETDPALAIGTAKELIETYCKTILAERDVEVESTWNIPQLTKAVLRELDLVPENVPESSRGADVIKRILGNLGSLGNYLAELRGLFGTGHGKHGCSLGLETRHAKLAVGAAATLVTFLFETHNEIGVRK
jgi:hypothetical protein